MAIIKTETRHKGGLFDQREQMNRPVRTAHSYIEVLFTMACILTLSTMYVYHTRSVPEQAKKLKCKSNMIRLHQAILIYSQNYQGNKYPPPYKWCDSLIKAGAHSDDLSIFVCPSAKPSEYTEKCHYAINPNAEPHSSTDMVLLFETKEGWNQSGGPELLNFDNHLGNDCCILLNNGSVEFIDPNHADTLKWKDDTQEVEEDNQEIRI